MIFEIYTGQLLLLQYCGIFAQRKNSGAKETAVASEQL
jgi:hypothetical protein